MKTAEYWTRTDGGKARCGLCPHHCALAEGADGLCRVRGVRGGDLVALAYGEISSAAVDPIEKKPLYHFHPGTGIFSIGGWGCNLACAFCQNWSISQQRSTGRAWNPAEVVREAASRSGGIAYTYNEPIVGFEFVRDCARLAKEAGLWNVLVTNGFVESEPAAELLRVTDALNLDVKSMEDSFYTEHCRGTLSPVLRFAVQAITAGCHLEVTNLVIPGLNDSERNFSDLSSWMKRNLGASVPLHLSAYRPEYKMEVAATPVKALEHARRVCARDLLYVYLGNVRDGEGSNTLCPQCSGELIRRRGYSTSTTGLGSDGRCKKCDRKAEVIL